MKTVKVVIDRPIGSAHPNHSDMVYPVNYGYVEGVFAPDSEEQDVYVLGVPYPIKSFCGKLIAIIHRKNDVEDKWVVCAYEDTFTKNEIEKQVHFTEQYFDSCIEMLDESDL